MKGSLRKYKDTGHFLFNVNDNLEKVCNAPNDKAGVYLVYALKDNDKHLIYVGSSGHIDNAGKLSIRKTGGGGIKGRIVNGHQFGKIKRHKSWPTQMQRDSIDCLEIHWFVTHNNDFKESPSYIEYSLLREHFIANNVLPKWNKKF